MQLTSQRMYQAILEKDSSFEGLFFTCVKTTRVFCRPVCTAKKPKLENVEFVRSAQDALAKGYRPCKICQPLKKLSETPESIQVLIDDIKNHPYEKITDQKLKQRKLEPHTVRRWFMKNHGMTFHTFKRMHRINNAFKKLKNGETVTSAALDTGFESLSGFADSFKAVFGVSPAKGKARNIIDITRLATPLGIMLAGATQQGVCLLWFTDGSLYERELKSLAKRLDATIVLGDNKHFGLLKQQLAEYFDGTRTEFSVPLVTPGTPFQQDVWKNLQTIPYGTTWSYLRQATILQKPKAVRAVSRANSMNRISILIPCHRVIGNDDRLAGYGGGLWRKKWLLDFEREHSTKARNNGEQNNFA